MSSKKKTLNEQIAELNAKIQLCEGDRKAFVQTSQYKIAKNDQKINSLRKENKELHQRYASSLNCDEDAINETFEDHKDEKPSFRNKSTQDAIKIMNNKKCDAKRRLDKQKYKTEEKRKQLENMNKRLEEFEADQKQARVTEEGESETGRRKRELENSLKKSEMKCQEALNITQTYCKILEQLEQESLRYPELFDIIKAEIERNREECAKLKEMQADAESSRDAAKAQLSRQEEQLRIEKREREERLKELRKQAEEKKQIQDRMDRRIQSRSAANANVAGGGAGGTNQDQESSVGGSGSGDKGGEESEKKISTYQEAFAKMSEATGVYDVEDIVDRFRTQDDTYLNLEEQKKKNQELIEVLTEEVKKCKEEYTGLRYSGETQLSHGERALEDANTLLEKEEKRLDDNDERQRETNSVLNNVRSGVEHLSIKLAHLKGTKSQEPKQTPSVDEEDYVLDLLMDCEDKLQKLMQDLGDTTKYEEIEKEFVADTGVGTAIDYNQMFENSLPQHNTRVHITSSNKEQTTVYDDVDSGEDEECLTRDQLKKRSDDLVNSKTKRRPQKKKKDKKK